MNLNNKWSLSTMLNNVDPTKTDAWQELKSHFEQMKDRTIQSLFAEDNDRASKFTLTFNDQSFVD